MITQTYTTTATIDEVWKALTEPEIIEQWSGAPAEMSANTDDDFKLWEGSIHGTNKKMEKGRFIEQDWYGGDWSKASSVRITLETQNDKTLIHLEHADVPQDEEKDFADGWRDYYFGPLIELLENSDV